MIKNLIAYLRWQERVSGNAANRQRSVSVQVVMQCCTSVLICKIVCTIRFTHFVASLLIETTQRDAKRDWRVHANRGAGAWSIDSEAH